MLSKKDCNLFYARASLTVSDYQLPHAAVVLVLSLILVPTQVILKTVNHFLLMMTGKTLEFFTVTPEQRLHPKGDLKAATIPPIEDMPILKLVFSLQFQVYAWSALFCVS